MSQYRLFVFIHNHSFSADLPALAANPHSATWHDVDMETEARPAPRATCALRIRRGPPLREGKQRHRQAAPRGSDSCSVHVPDVDDSASGASRTDHPAPVQMQDDPRRCRDAQGGVAREREASAWDGAAHSKDNLSLQAECLKEARPSSLQGKEEPFHLSPGVAGRVQITEANLCGAPRAREGAHNKRGTTTRHPLNAESRPSRTYLGA